MTTRVLVLEGLQESALRVLREGGLGLDERPAMSPVALGAAIRPYQGLVVRGGTQVTAEVLAAAPQLRVIGRPGSGIDNIDVEAAARHGVRVVHSPLGNVVPTAELTLALLLACARHVAQADASLKAGRWERKQLAGVELHGRRLGIIGLGRVGRRVAALARGIGMEVSASDPYVDDAVFAAHAVARCLLAELLATSDFITIHASLTPETRGLLGRDAFARMKPGARLVNAARGEIVDEDALREALDRGQLAAAGLDVHALEPPVDWRLIRHPRVVATPHLGSQTPDAMERVDTELARLLVDALR